MNDSDFLKHAIKLSKDSIDMGGYPAGAVIVKDGEIIATGVSNGKQICDATSHAETAAIREASQKLNRRNLNDVTLYSSLEPCLMCFSSSFWAYIPKVVFACSRNSVSGDYYEGDHNIFDINEQGRRVAQLIHAQELESDARKVIEEWERSRV